MRDHDHIGSAGELFFQAWISRRCYNRFFFRPIPMGEKHPTTDILVELVEPTRIQSVFYVQVKSTTLGYSGGGASRKLKVNVSREDIANLKQYPGPTYVAGIDVKKRRGYIAAIVSGMTGAVNGLPTYHTIDCPTIRALWAEVDAYWSSISRPIPMASSRFAI